MNVQEFLVFFRKEIPHLQSTESAFDDYQKKHLIFHELTSNFHNKAKQSYFEQINKLIDKNDFQKYYGIGTLSEFAYLGLFGEKDEVEFSNLIRKLTNKLDITDNESEIKEILDFIYSLTDFILHEYYPEEGGELRRSIIELKIKILEIEKYDHEKIGELIIRFLDLMI